MNGLFVAEFDSSTHSFDVSLTEGSGNNVTFGENDKSFDASLSGSSNELGSSFGNVVEITTTDHNKLNNRNLPDQHPISAITDLEKKLNTKVELSHFATNADINKMMWG